jgi:hypothetical protein
MYELTEMMFDNLLDHNILDKKSIFSLTRSFLSYDIIQLIYGFGACLIKHVVSSNFPISSKFETYNIIFKPYASSNESDRSISIGSFTVRPMADRHLVSIESPLFGSDYKVPVDFGSDMVPQLYQ